MYANLLVGRLTKAAQTWVTRSQVMEFDTEVGVLFRLLVGLTIGTALLLLVWILLLVLSCWSLLKWLVVLLRGFGKRTA